MADRLFPSARTSAELFEAFSFTGVVGEGQFGRVWRCVDCATGAPLACKQIRKSHLTPNELESLEREILAMESLQGHRNVLPLLGLYEDEKSVYILTELCDGGDIFSLIVQTGGIPERAAAMIFAQVADAVRWCHAHRIAHRDIKPENVLITTIAAAGAPDSPDAGARLEARLADFGLAMEIPRGFSLRGAVGSAPYEAPEVLAGDLYSFGADIWSLGVLLYATISAKWPSFPGNVRKFLPEVDFSVAPWPSVSVEAKDLIRRMLTLDASQRLDIDGVLAHPWLRIASARSESRKAPRDLKSSRQPSAPIVAPFFPPTEAPKLDFGPETAAPHPHSPQLDSRPDSSKACRNGCSSQSAADVDYSEATRIAGNSKASGAGVPRHASFDEWSECGAEVGLAEAGCAEAGCADLSEPVLRAAEADQHNAEAASCGAASAAIACWATSPRRPWSQRSPTSEETRRDSSRSSGGGGSGSRTNSRNSSSSSSSSVRPVRLKREVPLGNKEQSHTPSAAVSRLSPKAPSPRRQFRQSASSQSLCSEGLPLQPPKLPPFHRASPSASPSPRSCPPQGIPLQPSTPKAFPSFPQASPAAAASQSPRSCPPQGIPLQPSTPRTPKASPSPRGKTRTSATAALPKVPSGQGSAAEVSTSKPSGKAKPARSLAKSSYASMNERTLPSSSSTNGSGRRSNSGGRIRAWHRRSVSDVAHSPAADIAVPGLPTTSNLPSPDLYVSEHPGQHASGCPPCSRPPRIAIPTSPAMSDSYYDDADESECELTPTFRPQPAPEFPISSASSSARELSQQDGSPNNSVAKSRPKLPLMPAVTSSCSRYVRNLFTPASVTMASGPWQ